MGRTARRHRKYQARRARREARGAQGFCPACRRGLLRKRFRASDRHPFLGCSRYPFCTYTRDFAASPVQGTAPVRADA